MSNNDQTEWVAEIGETVGYIEAYFERRLQLLKLELAEQTARWSARVATALLFLCLGMICLTFLGLAFVFWLVEQWQCTHATGFLAGAAAFLLPAIGIYIFRRPLITNPVLSQLVKALFQ